MLFDGRIVSKLVEPSSIAKLDGVISLLWWPESSFQMNFRRQKSMPVDTFASSQLKNTQALRSTSRFISGQSGNSCKELSSRWGETVDWFKPGAGSSLPVLLSDMAEASSPLSRSFVLAVGKHHASLNQGPSRQIRWFSRTRNKKSLNILRLTAKGAFQTPPAQPAVETGNRGR